MTTTYYLWMQQNGGGCDYTIGCGEKLVPLVASTLDIAKVEAKSKLQDYVEDIEDSMILTLASTTDDITCEIETEAAAAYRLQEAEEAKDKIARLQRDLAKLEGSTS